MLFFGCLGAMGGNYLGKVVQRRKQDDLPGRPEVLRRLVEIGLKAKKSDARSNPNPAKRP
ncbi:hypothetical protein ACVW1B_005810 [Bradyrhizobium sp. USDA 4502]